MGRPRAIVIGDPRGWGDETEAPTRAQRWASERFRPSTWRTYRSRAEAFRLWCGSRHRSALDERALADWLAELADAGRSSVWIDQCVSAVLAWWSDRGGPVHLGPALGTVIGIRRRLRAVEAVDPTPPLEVEVWSRAAAALCECSGLTDTRDRALLVIGFLLAARAGELTGLRARDVRPVHDEEGRRGLEVTIRESKRAAGPVTIVLPAGAERATCPIDAWERLRALVGSHPAALPGTYYEVLQPHAVPVRTISRVVRRCAVLGGREGGDSGITAHSLRAGLARALAARGATLAEIQAAGRWRSVSGLLPYLREQRAWEAGRVLTRLGY